MRQDLSQAISSPPPAGDHETVNPEPGEVRLQRSQAPRREEVPWRELKSTEDGVIPDEHQPTEEHRSGAPHL